MNTRTKFPPIQARTSTRSLSSQLRRSGFAFMVLTVALLPGCHVNQWNSSVTGSGRLVTNTLELADFTKVAAGSAFQVTITHGDQYRVVATVDDNLVEHLDITRSHETLNIQLKPNTSIRNATLKAEVTMPDLIGLSLGGASRTTLAGFSSDKPLEVELSGASTVKGQIQSGTARFGASGASRIELQGGAQNLTVKASGASNVNLDRFTSTDTEVEASGASHVTVNPSGKLQALASGASSVRYLGTPASVNSEAMGASSVKKK